MIQITIEDNKITKCNQEVCNIDGVWIPLEEHREFIEEVEKRLSKYRKGKYIKLKEFLNQKKLKGDS